MPAAAFRAMPASPQSQSQQTSHNQSSRELPVLLPVRSDESIDMHDSADLEAERPRRFYYRDSTGKLRATRLWRWWTRVRRLLGFVVPLFKKDGNTFLCGPMVQNTVLNITLLFIRIFATQAILPWVLDGSLKAQECRHYARNFLDVSSYTLIAVVILCLPTLNIRQCKLHFQRESERGKALSVSDGSLATTGDNDEIELDADGKPQREDDSSKMRSRKTILLRICELTVILEVMYLCATLVMVFTNDSDVNIYDLIDACFHDEKTELVYGEVGGSGSDAPQYETYQEYLPARKLIIVVLVMALAVVAYIIRWRQIVLFHHMHLHFLFQAGIIPARARFDYEDQEDELELRRQARRGPIMRGWDRFRRRLDAVAPESFIRERERRRLKGAIYRAAKRGQVEDLRLCLEQALELDGPKFADKWYTQPEYRFVPLLFTCRRMCNPLHVAVVYDESETLRELLSLQDSEGRMCFNVNALDKMESHRITMSWIYLGVFRIFSAVLRIIEGRSQSSMVNVLRPFGPSGVFDYTLISPLHVATTMGNPEMVRMLLLSGSADPNVSSKARDPQFSTPPLFWVRNNVECAQLLLEADADPLHIPSLRDQNYRYAPGAFSLMTAYELARLSGNNAVARLMEAYGADVALTPLHNASAHGDVANVSFYLSHGADPDSLGEHVEGLHSRTPLHWAAIRGQADVVRTLLQFGASVEARDSMGRTPLAWACVLHRVSCVRVLLTHGANPNTRDINGDPLLCALAARTALKTRPLSRTASNLCVADMNVLQQPQFDQSPDDENTRDDGNDGGLDGKILKLLMNHGIDLKATREVNGDTALHVAMRRGNEHAAVLLVRAGLQLTARNARGQRALECTNSATLRYAVKKEAGQRDVMISYTHTHAALAMKLRDSLERANVTTWIDAMDPTGIPGGADWRREIASGIQNSALVVALLTRDYPQSPWCMKELAFARLHNVPVVGIQCEDMGVVPEELQVYLWTRQLVDFRPGIVKRPRHLLGGDEHHHGGTMLGSSDEETDEVEVRPITPDHGARGSVAVDIDAAPTTARLGSDSDEDEKEDGDGDNDDGMELIPDDSNSAFQECMQLLLDGIQDQIEEHRVRLEAQDANGGELRQTVLDNEEEQGHALGNASSSLARLVSSSDDTHPLVFIVHGDHHGAFCRRLRVALARRGIRAIDNQNAFIDAEGSSRGASTSQMRQIAAKDAIVASAAVIAVLSPTTVASGMLADQLAFAEDRGKVVIPLLLSLHSVALAHRYSFARSSVHHVNASLGFQESVTRLASELRGHLPSHFGTMVGDGHDKGLSRVSSLSSISDVVEVNSPSSFYGTAANANDRENKRRTGSGGSGGGHGHGWRLRSPTNADDRNGSPPRQRTPTPPHRNGSTSQPRTPPPLLRIRSMDSGNEVGGESGVDHVDERRRASSNGDKPSRDHRQAR